MSEPLPKALFDARIDQLGLSLTPEERAGIHAASAHLAAALARVRGQRVVSVEPATIFVAGERGA